MSSDRSSVEIVLVHYGCPAVTLRAIEAASASRGPPAGITVVDNGPGEDGQPELRPFLEALAGAFPRGVDSVRPARNLGYAGGLAEGVRRASRRGRPARWFLMNNDVFIEPDTLGLLSAVLDERPDAGAVGPAVLLDEGDESADRGETVWNAGSDIAWPAARPVSRLHGRPAAELPAEPYEAGYLAGCAVLVPAAVLSRVGLAEDYFLYFEDADLGERIRRAGLRSLVVPAARVRHRAGSATAAAEDIAAYHRVRNRIVFSRRWGRRDPATALARWWFAARKLLGGGPAARGAWDGIRGASADTDAAADTDADTDAAAAEHADTDPDTAADTAAAAGPAPESEATCTHTTTRSPVDAS